MSRFFPAWQSNYSPVADKPSIHVHDAGAAETDIHPDINAIYSHKRHRKSLAFMAWEATCIILFLSGAAMLLAAWKQAPSDSKCTAQLLGAWTPQGLLDAVEYVERDLDNDYIQPTGYTGRPTPEIDARWAALHGALQIIVPADRLGRLHRNASQHFVAAQVGDSTGYVAVIESFHYLHCLDKIRQFLWRDSYVEAAANGNGKLPLFLRLGSVEKQRDHALHCVETLRQNQMCRPDLTPYIIYRTSASKNMADHEDFAAAHKCLRFDLLQEWLDRNGFWADWDELAKLDVLGMGL